MRRRKRKRTKECEVKKTMKERGEGEYGEE